MNLVCGKELLFVGLVTVRAAAAAWQPYSSPEQLVSCAPEADGMQRTCKGPQAEGPSPRGWFFLGYVVQNQGEKHTLFQWNVEVRGRDMILQVLGGRYGQVGTIPPFQKNLCNF